MAPSRCHIMISFLVAVAVILPSLHPSTVAGAEGEANKADAAAAAPSPDGEVLHPTGRNLNIPDLPLPRILPCPPWFPKIPLIPCYNVTPPPPPQPRECRSSLRRLMPCAGFLTNASVPAPPNACCDGFDPFFADQSSDAALLCLCHIASAELLPAPVNHTRVASVMEECGLGLPIDALSSFCQKQQ
nr:unnamed protein product [Digitaria exilis]